VLQAQQKAFDYLVGARLEGFPQSVNITDAPLIVCEGDEYPASVIEKRPKFHFLHPHIAVLSGIAWDHINVFPTFDNYLEQFAIFIRQMEPGHILIYNSTDEVLSALVDKEGRHLKLVAYTLPIHMITEGVTRVYFEEGFSDLQVFGDHNLLNLHAARLVCNELGITDDAFLQSIATFKGAAKRLELVGKNKQTAVYRDFAHAPSKVKATIQALQQQYPHRKLIAVLELHTYSSLNAGFMDQYQGAMDPANEAVVFYSKHALEIKRMPELLPERIAAGFARKDLHVFNQRAQLEAFLDAQQYKDTNLLLMSSGDYEGLDIRSLWEKIK